MNETSNGTTKPQHHERKGTGCALALQRIQLVSLQRSQGNSLTSSAYTHQPWQLAVWQWKLSFWRLSAMLSRRSRKRWCSSSVRSCRSGGTRQKREGGTSLHELEIVCLHLMSFFVILTTITKVSHTSKLSIAILMNEIWLNCNMWMMEAMRKVLFLGVVWWACGPLLACTHSFYLSVLQLFVTVVLVVCKGTGNLCILAVHYGAFQTVPDMKDTHTHTHATSTYGCIYDLIWTVTTHTSS